MNDVGYTRDNPSQCAFVLEICGDCFQQRCDQSRAEATVQRLLEYQNAALDNVYVSLFNRDSLNIKLSHRPDESAPNVRVKITPRSMS